jgi:hypothetical protein
MRSQLIELVHQSRPVFLLALWAILRYEADRVIEAISEVCAR